MYPEAGPEGPVFFFLRRGRFMQHLRREDENDLVDYYRSMSAENRKKRLEKGGKKDHVDNMNMIRRWQEKLDLRALERGK